VNSKQSTTLLAHDARDGVLIGLASVQMGVLVWSVLSFGHVAWQTSVALGIVCVLLICTNFQCVAHNFIHNPFFRSKRANRIFSVFNSLLIGGAQTLYRFHHLNHHRWNNDLPDPESGLPRDDSSTWRHGRPPEAEEPLLTYALFGYFRTDFGELLATARRKKQLGQVAIEYLAFAAFLATLTAINWRGVVFLYLPVWFLGNVAAVAENYLEHFGATPGDRRRDSVSSYGRLYNLVWFNNGYHQEHHYRPQVHWTRVPEVRAELPPETERRVVKGAHWFNFAPREPLATASPASVGGRPARARPE
jgi:fatty acid desaturase